MKTRNCLARLKEVEIWLNEKVLDRERVIRQIILALLTKEHVLLFGETGTGKSYLSRAVFNCFKSPVFSIQLNEYMTDDSIFGPINPKKVREEGVIEYNVDGMLPTATFAFLDEFFDASGNLRRSLLEVLNERTFSRGRQKLVCPLHTAIATSNYVDAKEESEAVFDRFLFRSKIQSLSVKSRIKLLKLKGDLLDGPKMPYGMLEHLSKKAFDVRIRSTSRKALLLLVDQFSESSSVKISDRRLFRLMNVLRAVALLDGREKVAVRDLEELSLVLPVLHEGKQMEAFASSIVNVLAQYGGDKKNLVSEGALEDFGRMNVLLCGLVWITKYSPHGVDNRWILGHDSMKEGLEGLISENKSLSLSRFVESLRNSVESVSIERSSEVFLLRDLCALFCGFLKVVFNDKSLERESDLHDLSGLTSLVHEIKNDGYPMTKAYSTIPISAFAKIIRSLL